MQLNFLPLVRKTHVMIIIYYNIYNIYSTRSKDVPAILFAYQSFRIHGRFVLRQFVRIVWVRNIHGYDWIPFILGVRLTWAHNIKDE